MYDNMTRHDEIKLALSKEERKIIFYALKDKEKTLEDNLKMQFTNIANMSLTDEEDYSKIKNNVKLLLNEIEEIKDLLPMFQN